MSFSPIAVVDIEAVLDSSVPPSPPRANMANEVAQILAPLAHLTSLSLEARGFVSEHLNEVRPHPGDFPPPPCWKVVCVGVATLAPDGALEDLACLRGKTEEEILREVARIFSETRDEHGRKEFPEHTVVTFNGRHFDVPVLTMRAARYGIQLPFWSTRWHYRYAEEPHFDLLDFWSAYGGAPRPSLSQVARLFGLPGKREGETGDSVAKLVDEGRLAEVKTYCLSDVVQTAGVFLRTQHFRGKTSTAEYRAAARRLLEACEGAFDPGLAWVSEKTDRKVFLLE